jgi:hypothetical protein
VADSEGQVKIGAWLGSVSAISKDDVMVQETAHCRGIAEKLRVI